MGKNVEEELRKCEARLRDSEDRLEFAISERKQADKHIELLNAHLATRAAELDAANKELETFSYSVTHDLRKPLTVINGYCQVILDFFGAALDEQCKEYLLGIYDGTVRMNQLIDALLKFSLLARSEMRREPVDLSVMAKIAIADLVLSEPGRHVTFRIANGLTVIGDGKLLQVVMENLLGNAWKYTGKQDEAVIEFGVTDSEGEPVYYVRDNGAGFDMAFVNNLFVPFQRLPGSHEYDGHGIGLATVERIIKRHCGRIWAEGVQGKGATFFFTVPA